MTDVDQFKEVVSEYVNIGDNVAQATEKIKVLKKRMGELEDSILDYMESNELDICHLADGTKLRRATSKRQGPFNPKTVREVMNGYITDETKLNEAFEKINEKRGEQTSVSLKRVKR
jgi:hypothetical protein